MSSNAGQGRIEVQDKIDSRKCEAAVRLPLGHALGLLTDMGVFIHCLRCSDKEPTDGDGGRSEIGQVSLQPVVSFSSGVLFPSLD